MSRTRPEMIGRSALLALSLFGGGCVRQEPAVRARVAHPMRVMSMNQCTDQLVLALLPPTRIASVTWLSRDPRFSAEIAAARRVRVNHGGVEEVVATRPDLIVTDTFSNPAGRGLLERLGYPLVEVADADDIAAIRRNVRTVAAALDERARGEALIARMDTALAGPPRAAGRVLRVAAWDRDGMGSGPILKTVLAAAGLADVGGTSGDVETLLAAAPDLLIDRETGVGTASLGDNRAHHPLVRRRWGPDRRLRIPQAALFCATPAVGMAATVLRAQARAALGAGRGPAA